MNSSYVDDGDDVVCHNETIVTTLMIQVVLYQSQPHLKQDHNMEGSLDRPAGVIKNRDCSLTLVNLCTCSYTVI